MTALSSGVRRLARKHAADPWEVVDLEPVFSAAAPPSLSRAPDDERALVQYLTDFQHIERMAGALFAALRDRVASPELRSLLDRYVADEDRHAAALERLARHHDRRGLGPYRPTPSLVRLGERLAAWVRVAPLDAAAIGVTVGELAFDIAYLGPLAAFASDPATAAVLARIHRDEARHLALDHLLLDGAAQLDDSASSPAPLPVVGLAWVRLVAAGFPFMRDTFFGTSARLDPSGARLREAARRIELALDRPAVRGRPAARVFRSLQAVFDAPAVGAVVRAVFGRVLRADPELFRRQSTRAERAAARVLDADAAAEEAWRVFATFTTPTGA